MQKVKIKEVHTKTGKNEKGEWINTLIVGEDGSKFGTFHKGAQEIKEGYLIELDPIVKGDRVNFEKYTILERSPSLSSSNGHSQNSEREIKIRVQLLQMELASQEARTAYEGIMQVAATGVSFGEHIQTFSDMFGEALKWASSRLNLSPEATKQKTTPVKNQAKDKPSVTTGKGEVVNPDAPFPHVGALLKFCNERGIGRAKFMEIQEIKEADLARINIEDAFIKVKDYIKEHGKPKDPNDPEGLFD